MLRHFDGLKEALKAIYPQHSWEAEKFVITKHAAPGFWVDKQNLLNELDRAEKALGIKQVCLTNFRHAGVGRGRAGGGGGGRGNWHEKAELGFTPSYR